MALATYRHNDTGDLLELSEDWLTRFPKDPYTLLTTDELAKIEAEKRAADIGALGAKPIAQDDETPAPAAAPTAKVSGDGGEPAPDPRDGRRF